MGVGERWDIVAWNRAASVIHGDLTTIQGIERNGLYQLFLGDRMRSILVDWEAHARRCVAKLRTTYASRVDDPWFNELVTLLVAYVPAPGTGTREKMETLLAAREPLLPSALESV